MYTCVVRSSFGGREEETSLKSPSADTWLCTVDGQCIFCWHSPVAGQRTNAATYTFVTILEAPYHGLLLFFFVHFFIFRYTHVCACTVQVRYKSIPELINVVSVKTIVRTSARAGTLHYSLRLDAKGYACVPVEVQNKHNGFVKMSWKTSGENGNFPWFSAIYGYAVYSLFGTRFTSVVYLRGVGGGEVQGYWTIFQIHMLV